MLSLLCAGLLANGDFEQGPKPWQMEGTVVTDPTAIPGWRLSGFVEYIHAGQTQKDMLLVVPEGAFAVRLGNDAAIRQRVRVAAGAYYALTFTAARTCAQEERLNVSAAPAHASGVIPMQTLYSSSGWDSYSWGFRAAGAAAEIVIGNPGEEEDPACGPLVDSIALKVLHPPRPTTST